MGSLGLHVCVTHVPLCLLCKHSSHPPDLAFHLENFVCVFVCVMYMHMVHVHLCAGTCPCACGGQVRTSGVLFCHLRLITLRQALFLNLELTD